MVNRGTAGKDIEQAREGAGDVVVVPPGSNRSVIEGVVLDV